MRCAAIAPLVICGAANAEQVSEAGLGLTIEIPGDWSELPTTQVNKGSSSSLAKDNPEIAEAVRKHGFIPLHLFGRIARPDSPFSASFDLSTRSATSFKGQSDQQALLALLASSAQQMPNAKVVTAPEIVSAAGRPAAHIILTSALVAGGSMIPIAVEAWVFPRGSYYLVLGATYHADPKFGDRAGSDADR